ncbi:hypothetical protein LX64_01468 [Chitinophaga skermanii]|uniref:Uncharacterized protein n=1 Tax=Chitinophaga skermanii TaxID=331697 RepID=A0A327QYM7_9BACT|nr:hypothetical protein [Chitinophaga skermanii]RAJ08814.1 hypothetical protein LX64_01468 [Chitinophaga skermanii]
MQTFLAVLLSIHSGEDKAPVFKSPISITQPVQQYDPYFLQPADAENILGQKVDLKEYSKRDKSKTVTFKCAYAATTIDSTTGKQANLFYMLIQHATVEAAEKSHTSEYNSNKRLPGMRKVAGLGDEAFEQTDRENFYFFEVRKQHTIIRIKINKLTSKTNIAALEGVVRKLLANAN